MISNEMSTMLLPLTKLRKGANWDGSPPRHSTFETAVETPTIKSTIFFYSLTYRERNKILFNRWIENKIKKNELNPSIFMDMKFRPFRELLLFNVAILAV